jgi:hypothetical protein
MRSIEQIVVHCAATKPSLDVGVAEIRGWHKQRGWADIGYHYVIRRNGEVEKGRPDAQPGAHVAGHNQRTLGVCMVGGLDADGNPAPDYTPEQWRSLRELLDDLQARYDVDEDGILGHRDFPGVGKACPSFDVRRWWTTGDVKA